MKKQKIIFFTVLTLLTILNIQQICNLSILIDTNKSKENSNSGLKNLINSENNDIFDEMKLLLENIEENLFLEDQLKEPKEEQLEQPGAINSGDWTIIQYIDGADEYTDVDFGPPSSGSNSNVNVLALDDGHLDGDSHAYYILDESNIEISLSDINSSWIDEVNMGDPNTLISFSKYCIDNYPSENYLVILQDHGGAWMGSCWDEDWIDLLNITDLKMAFSRIKSYLGRNIDVLLFNGCMMSNIDITTQLYPYMDYIVGSETIAWTSTWGNCEPLIDTIKTTPSITPQDLAVKIVDLSYLVDNQNYITQSVCAIDCSKIQGLLNDFIDLTNELINKFSTYQIEIENARSFCDYFNGPLENQTDCLIDLYDFVENVYNEIPDVTIQSYALNIMDNLGPNGGGIGYTIIKEKHTSICDFCHGLSIYFPLAKSLYKDITYEVDGEIFSASYTLGNDFCSATNWDEFLWKYYTYDAYEDNNDYNSAFDTSSYEQIWLSTVDGHGIQADDDWYQIYLPIEQYQLIVNLTYTYTKGNIDIEIYDSEGNIICGTDSTSDEEYIEYAFQSGGIYFIRVFGDNAGNDYDLWWASLMDSRIYINDNTPSGSFLTWEEAKGEGLCTGSGFLTDPYVIENKTINCLGSGSGIYISGSDKYFTISECTIYNAGSIGLDAGITLENVRNGELVGNNCSFNPNKGIALLWSNGNVITGNIVNNNFHGIYLDNSYENKISGNTINDNDLDGMLLFSSDNNIILENAIVDNIQYGLRILGGSANNLICFNNFSGNGINALDISFSPPYSQWDDGAFGNWWDDYEGIDENNDGIGDIPYDIQGRPENQDHFPLINLHPIADFVANNVISSAGQKIEFGFIGSEGNTPATYLWEFGDDTTSTDKDPIHTYISIGIFTITLIVTDINGDIDTLTKHDYIVINDSPIIDHPDDISYNIGETENIIKWNVDDAIYDVCEYNVYMDGDVYKTGTWSSGIPIEINVDGLEIGTYIFTIQISDGLEGFTSEVVEVEVISINIIPATPYIVEAMIMTFVCMTIFLNWITKRRKLRK